MNSIEEINNSLLRGIDGNTKINIGLTAFVDHVRARLTEYNVTLFANMAQELATYRKLDHHIQAGTLTDEIARELLAEAAKFREETANKVGPLVKRLQSLVTASKESTPTPTPTPTTAA